MTPAYVLDANVFIEAAERYYAFDLVPAFWNVLVEQAAKGRVLSIDRVRQEITRCNNSLADWANKEFQNWFARSDEQRVIRAYQDIMTWVYHQNQFFDSAKYEFASGADGWLVAYGKAHGHVVVTHEQFRRDIRRRIPIPNVCVAFGVPFVDTFTMLRQLGVKLA
ncbi:MAG TPA: DUF4411 family protein [Firmicutes bacterium]|nr:DUF4411 family protein [Candidatus Fermentithermobacillaceae bacterium]